MSNSIFAALVTILPYYDTQDNKYPGKGLIIPPENTRSAPVLLTAKYLYVIFVNENRFQLYNIK